MVESHNTNFDNDDSKEVYYHVCQAFNVEFNSRNVNLTYEQFLKGSTIRYRCKQQCCLVAETRQF